MTRDVWLVGPLADPAMLAALGVSGTPGTLRGRLTAAARAGIDRDGWPRLMPDDDAGLLAVRVAPGPALSRYAEIFGLAAQDHDGTAVLGVQTGAADAPGPWRGDLAAAIARAVLALSAERPAAAIAARLPQIAVWADSQLRAESTPAAGAPLTGDHSPDPLRIAARRQPYADFFAVEEWDLSHRRHDGGWTPVVRRAGFVMGDAVVVLPWDMARDRVLLIEQFRVAPAMRGDRQPWLIETIAGRIDAGETPEGAARREAQEEAGLDLGRMWPAVHHYPSPGAVGEFLYLFVASADLPDEAAGIHGLAAETEDIRSHLVPRAELTRMALAGQITNGPLALLALWLAAQAERLRTEAAAGGVPG